MGQNFGAADVWGIPKEDPCGYASTTPPRDVQLCDGELHDSVDDGGGVTSLAAYPKQPFDFAGRTGAISFDVSNNSQGSHAAWPEIWVSDQPVPDPFTHLGDSDYPRNAFGVRFAGCTNAGGTGVTCPGGSAQFVGVDSAVTVTDYVANDSFKGGSIVVEGTGNAVKESRPGEVNHYEIDVNASRIDVYGTDAFTLGRTMPPLQHLATIPNVNLAFTRGLVWLEDVHYNACKFNRQCDNTFNWANFGFDGPVLTRDLTFDVPDSLREYAGTMENGTTGIQLGYGVGSRSSVSLKTMPVTAANIAAATQAGVLVYLWFTSPRSTLTFAVNGHQLREAWPFPASGQAAYTILMPVPLNDLVTGPNTIEFTSPAGMNVANVNLWLANAGGRPPPPTRATAP
jgi:hypothetical protein